MPDIPIGTGRRRDMIGRSSVEFAPGLLPYGLLLRLSSGPLVMVGCVVNPLLAGLIMLSNLVSTKLVSAWSLCSGCSSFSNWTRRLLESTCSAAGLSGNFVAGPPAVIVVTVVGVKPQALLLSLGLASLMPV